VKKDTNGVVSAAGDKLALGAHTRDEINAAGKALRDRVPHRDHGRWKPAARRSDPIDVLIESSKGRVEHLVPIRYGRMMQSPFAFYRGAAAIMAEDLSHTPVSGVIVQANGDCHLLNFGGFATPERRLVFDMNDFDETLPAPWEWDVKRLAASFVIAGRNNRLKKGACRNAALMAVRGYRERMAELSAMPTLEAWYSYIDLKALIANTRDSSLRKARSERVKKEAGKGASEVLYPKLVDASGGQPRIKDDPPLIFHVDQQQDPAWQPSVKARLASYRESLPHERQVLFDRYRHVDVAAKVVGVGSVGTVCAVALFLATDDDPLFLQMKEARASVLAPYASKSDYKNNGQRIVVGQRIMQAASDIFLGWGEDAQDGRQYYVRQLRDAKIAPLVEMFDADILAEYAEYCGWALARCHARSGKSGVLSGYMGKRDEFDEAVADFSEAYADQNEADHAALLNAVRSGRLEAIVEER
jgi:uncharacterized protein (DUF2252 family)